MKTTRRQFLKSLLATAATAAIAPQVLVESVHGASDLTAHERDVAADVMGLRSKQWRGHVAQTGFIAYPVLQGADGDGFPRFGQVVLPRGTPEAEILAELKAAAKRVAKPFRATWVDESEEWDRQILWGRPGGQMPVGVLGADEIDEVWKHSDEERPAMLFGHPVETGTFRQSIDGLRFEPERKHSGGYHRGGYLVPLW